MTIALTSESGKTAAGVASFPFSVFRYYTGTPGGHLAGPFLYRSYIYLISFLYFDIRYI
jgi:hypothetical protein